MTHSNPSQKKSSSKNTSKNSKGILQNIETDEKPIVKDQKGCCGEAPCVIF